MFVVTDMTLSFRRKTFDWHNVWFLQLWYCHNVMLFGELIFDTSVILSFIQQTFCWQYVLLIQLWPCHLADRHLADTTFDTTVTLSIARQTFGQNSLVDTTFVTVCTTIDCSTNLFYGLSTNCYSTKRHSGPICFLKTLRYILDSPYNIRDRTYLI